MSLASQIQQANRKGKNRLPSRQPGVGAIERDYLRVLLQMIREQEAITKEILFPAIEKAAKQREAERMDAWMQNLTMDFSTLVALRKSARERAEEKVSGIAQKISMFSRYVFGLMVKKTLAVDVTTTEPWVPDMLTAWSLKNSELISSVSAQNQSEVSRLAVEGVSSGRNVRDIQADIKKRFRVSEGRAKTIARTETAKLNSELTQTRQEKIGIRTYYWQTADDERVRGNPSGKFPKADPRHDILDGMLCRWDDPSVYSDDNGKTWQRRSRIDAYEGHPGTDFSCRCVARANTEELLERLGI